MEQSVYVNGHLVAHGIKREAPDQIVELKHAILKPGKNIYAIAGPPLVKRHQWEELNTDPGIIRIFNPEGQWKRSVFNGLAQVIVQSTEKSGTITLTATSLGLAKGELKIEAQPSPLRPAVP